MNHASPIVKITMPLCKSYNARPVCKSYNCKNYIVKFTRQDRMGVFFSGKKCAGFGVFVKVTIVILTKIFLGFALCALLLENERINKHEKNNWISNSIFDLFYRK